jgi:hypothetical protein
MVRFLVRAGEEAGGRAGWGYRHICRVETGAIPPRSTVPGLAHSDRSDACKEQESTIALQPVPSTTRKNEHPLLSGK